MNLNNEANFFERFAKLKLEKIYAAFMLVFGTIMCFVLPPHSMNDEVAHFGRIWEISEGVFVSDAATCYEIVDEKNVLARSYISVYTSLDPNNVPQEILTRKFLVCNLPSAFMDDGVVYYYEHGSWSKHSADDVKKFFRQRYAPDTVIYPIPNTGTYSLPAYAPQVAAAFVARHVTDSVGAIYYTMRISALVTMIFFVVLAMRFLPEKKLLIFVLGTMPMWIWESISLSADTVTYGFCFVVTAWLLSLRKSNRPFSASVVAGLIVSAILLGLFKQVYGTILLLYFLIPRERMKNPLRFIVFGLFLLVVALASSAVWINIVTRGGNPDLLYSAYWYGADMAAQKQLVISNPLAFVAAFYHSLKAYSFMYIKGFVEFIYYFGMSEWVTYAYMVLLPISALFGKLDLKKMQRFFMVLAFGCTFLGMFAVEYLMWSRVGGNIVDGVQGRYFIPVSLMFFCGIACLPPLKYENVFAVAAGLFGVLTTGWYTYGFFY